MKKQTHIPTDNIEEKSYSKKFLQRKLEEQEAEKQLREWRHWNKRDEQLKDDYRS